MPGSSDPRLKSSAELLRPALETRREVA